MNSRLLVEIFDANDPIQQISLTTTLRYLVPELNWYRKMRRPFETRSTPTLYRRDMPLYPGKNANTDWKSPEVCSVAKRNAFTNDRQM